jgi:hypothetical protein
MLSLTYAINIIDEKFFERIWTVWLDLWMYDLTSLAAALISKIGLTCKMGSILIQLGLLSCVYMVYAQGASLQSEALKKFVEFFYDHT